MSIHRSLLRGAAVTAYAFAAAAAAQFAGAADSASAPLPLEEVVITGSRIATPGLDSVSPVQVLTAEDIQNSGVANVQDLLQKDPAISTPTLSRTNSNFLTSGAGVATVDLRNLGTSRTLVLVDGRRFVSGVPGDTAVDLNSIPTGFIERIDVLTGGASAVYGSDAVAGVVNIIYKKHFEGVAFDGQYGESTKSDNKQSQFGVTLGTNIADGRGNVMTYIGYSKQGAVFSRDRERSAVDQASVGAFITGLPEDMFTIQRPFYSSFAPAGRYFLDAGSITFDANGNAIPFSTNGPNGDGVGATGFNRSAYRTIAVPVERYLLATRGNFDWSENHGAFVEGTYALSTTDSKLEPFPFSSATNFLTADGQVPAESLVNGVIVRNPLVPDAIYNNISDTNGDGLKDYSFTRRMSDIGARGNTADRNTFRIVAGLEGKIFGDWKYEVFSSFGQTSESQISGGQLSVQNLLNALQAIPDGIGGVECADPTARAQGCVPADIFGANKLSPAAAAYLYAPVLLYTRTTEKVTGASLAGEAFQMPAGPVGIAAGVEHRSEFARSQFDALTVLGLNANNAIPPTEGKFDVNEFYAEAEVPLLAKLPAFEALNLRAAVRQSDYSTVGNTTTWNVGLDWKLNDQFRFRAIRGVSVRAPNINELYSPPSQNFPTGLVDPCVGVTATSTGAVSTVCRADPGVAANIAANGVFTQTQSDLQGYSGYDLGNPNVKQEKGKSWTVGMVFTPEGALKNLGLTVDYFKIDIDKAIVSTDRQFILQQCYGGDASFCQFITRRPTAAGGNSAGSLLYVNSGVTNSGGQSTSGVDLTLSYNKHLGPGHFKGRLTYTDTISGWLIAQPGTDKNQTAGEIGASKQKAVLNLGYDLGKFSANWTTTYLGSASLDDQFLISYGLAPGSVGIGAWTYSDIQLKFALTGGTDLYVGADNVFDKQPPPIISGLPGDVTGSETDSGTYDAIGRRWYAGFRVKF